MQFRSILNLYNPTLAATLVGELRYRQYAGFKLLGWFWHSRDFKTERRLSETERSAAVFIGLAMVAQIAFGVGLLIEWARYGTAGAWEFGIALLLSYPLVWAHLLALGATLGWVVYYVIHPKKAGRQAVCTVLEWQVRQLRARHDFKVVAVVGSVGKTSTKLAVADLLGQTMRVRYQSGNYNDRVTVPLIFFGLEEPNIFNLVAWLKIFGATQSEIALPYSYDVVVVELGTDGPGQLKQFAYLKPDITVVTAVSAEHMEYFKTLDGVADEELTVFDYSSRVLVNGDDIAGEYLAGRDFIEYSLTSEQAQYGATAKPIGLQGQTLHLRLSKRTITAEVPYLGDQGAKVTLAAAAVADMLQVSSKAIASGLPKLKPFPGRMQVLHGMQDTTLVDDTYNASPVAIKAALDVLYKAKASQRIAIIGSMNELGAYSRQAHEEIGAYCDPKKLDIVITIGKDAKKWLAPIAKEQGCTVRSFLSPYDAGAFVAGKLKTGAVVLAKGSQNGVFAEEALKPLLANPADSAKLVRQSASWMSRKRKQFPADF